MEQPAKILLVDDQETNLLLLNEFVKTLGLRASQANNGLQALERVVSEAPDLILLDVMMPEMDGQQVLECLMGDPCYRHIPVIMISAIDDIDRVAGCISQGALDYLVKPFNLTLLKARVFSCLETKRLHDRDKENRHAIEVANLKINQKNESLLDNNRILEIEIKKRIRAERDLRMSQRQSLRNAHAAGMAELASSVLHNVGNALNSVNISCHQLWEIVNQSCFVKLTMANKLLLECFENCPNPSKRCSVLVTYYQSLGESIKNENQRMRNEIKTLMEKTETIKNIIQSQPTLSTGTAFTESLDLAKVVNDVLNLQAEFLTKSEITVQSKILSPTLVTGQKIKASYVVLNLLINAREAIEQHPTSARMLFIEIGEAPNSTETYLKITDTGEGIPPSSLNKIFHQGFTTKDGAHGFGLHTSAIAVNEMNGRIEAHSSGHGTGATFTLFLDKYVPSNLGNTDSSLE